MVYVWLNPRLTDAGDRKPHPETADNAKPKEPHSRKRAWLTPSQRAET